MCQLWNKEMRAKQTSKYGEKDREKEKTIKKQSYIEVIRRFTYIKEQLQQEKDKKSKQKNICRKIIIYLHN